MRDGSSITPEPTSPQRTIPGWRLILSDAGRLWASRERPFSDVAAHAGAERTVDGDSLEELRAETDRQETFAREAEERAAKEQEEQEAPASAVPASKTREQQAQEQVAREQEASKAPAPEVLAPKAPEQAGQVIA